MRNFVIFPTVINKKYQWEIIQINAEIGHHIDQEVLCMRLYLLGWSVEKALMKIQPLIETTNIWPQYISEHCYSLVFIFNTTDVGFSIQLICILRASPQAISHLVRNRCIMPLNSIHRKWTTDLQSYMTLQKCIALHTTKSWMNQSCITGCFHENHSEGAKWTTSSDKGSLLGSAVVIQTHRLLHQSLNLVFTDVLFHNIKNIIVTVTGLQGTC